MSAADTPDLLGVQDRLVQIEGVVDGIAAILNATATSQETDLGYDGLMLLARQAAEAGRGGGVREMVNAVKQIRATA